MRESDQVTETVFQTSVDLLRERIIDEIFLAFKLPAKGWLRRWFGPLFRLPTQRFAEHFAAADDAIAEGGMPAGCRVVVERFGIGLDVRGADAIPECGALLIVSNHPGVYDSVSIGAQIWRSDLKIIVFETPFYHAMQHADKQFIYVTPGKDTRMLAIRQAIEHLQNGGALLQFGSGLIEPDPALYADTEETLKDWSPSIEIMLRKVPETRLVLTAVSGVLLRRFARSPLTQLVRGGINQRRVAEFTQVITQLISPKRVRVETKISFAPPVGLEALEAESGGGRLMGAILQRERRLLREHRESF